LSGATVEEYASDVEVAASNAVLTLGRRPATHRLVALGALIAALLLLAPPAHARSSASLSLIVTFTSAGTITVTLPNGTPVGTTSGAPTVIPAGYYTLLLTGPGNCTYLPAFELRGPGANILDDMRGGEWETSQDSAYFLPNSTYTWRNDANPSIVFTFRTSADVVGTPTANGVPNPASGPHSTVSSQDLVGSGVVPFRGTLAGGVSAAGRLTISYNGKSVSRLKKGRYTIAVADQSSTNGFLLQKGNHGAVSISGTTFVGKHKASVNLTVGKWLLMTQPGKPTFVIVVT
jgi:hypothetical protein